MYCYIIVAKRKVLVTGAVPTEDLSKKKYDAPVKERRYLVRKATRSEGAAETPGLIAGDFSDLRSHLYQLINSKAYYVYFGKGGKSRRHKYIHTLILTKKVHQKM